jgi:hypothetical protein
MWEAKVGKLQSEVSLRQKCEVLAKKKKKKGKKELGSRAPAQREPAPSNSKNARVVSGWDAKCFRYIYADLLGSPITVEWTLYNQINLNADGYYPKF